MVISRSPMRIGLAGGGTDLKWYSDENVGHILNMSIDKYVTVTINKSFDKKYRLHYSDVEVVDSINQISNKRIYHALKYCGFTEKSNPVEIHVMSDLPMKGTGLASSSAFINALVKGIHHYVYGKVKADNVMMSPSVMINNTSWIENDLVGELSGIQDHVAPCFYGLNYITTHNGYINIDHPSNSNEFCIFFSDLSCLVYINQRDRKSTEILNEQKDAVLLEGYKKIVLDNMAKEAYKAYVSVDSKRFHDALDCITEANLLKDKLHNQLSNEFKELYNNYGIRFIKYCGAGEGGFALICFKGNKEKTVFINDYSSIYNIVGFNKAKEQRVIVTND